MTDRPIPRQGRRLRPLSRQELLRRGLRFALFGLAFLLLALAVGIAGYRWIAGLSLIDAFFNASMILSGMGPVSPMQTDAAKLFASLYALVGGAVYPVVMAVVVYPFLHHMLVLLHLQATGSEDSGGGG